MPDFLSGSASLEDIAEHLEHVVELTDISNVGFGSDFDGVKRLPSGMTDCTVWPSLMELLESRGWSSNDLASVGDKNWKRIIPDK